MKKETAKKNKLWLWIGLGVVALLAVVGIVLALVLGGQGQGSKGGRADLYWNVDRVTYTKDSESGLSTREAAADGMYYVKFAYNGEQVELPVADKRLINYIDTMDLMGLVIDRDGVVTDAIDPTQLAVEKGKGIYYVETKDGEIVANSAVTLNGLAMRFAITDKTQIYNVSNTASVVGEIIQPDAMQVMDTIHVYANDQDEITHVYFVESPLQSKIYWRMDQMWNSTLKDTTREPDENGVYTIPYWCDGEEVEIKTKDRKLVAEIDNRSFYWCHSAFRFDEEGYAAARINTGTATRTISLVDCYDVMEIDGNNISTQPFGNGTPVNFKVTENTKIYDVSNLAKALGTAGQQVDSLQINDRVSVWTDKDGNAVTIYVASRRCDSPIYFNVERQWSGTEKSTKRTPNADGLYEIELWSEATGKQTYLMTKEQVDFVDAEGYRVCGLKADGKLVQEVYPFEAIFGYPAVCNGRWVTDVTGSIFTILSPANGTETNWMMTADCKVYDMSGHGEYGEVTEIRFGDNVKVFRNPPGEIVCMIIDARQTGGDTLYFNLNRQYDDKAKETKRLPDENGWYVFDMAHNGKTVQVKTKSKEIASKVEAFNPGAVVLYVNNGIIQKVFDPVSAYCGKKVASAFYFEGYDAEGQAVFGYEGRDDLIYPVSEDLEVFDVSTNSFTSRGALTTLQKGDWVTGFTDLYGELRVVFVRARKADAAAYNFERLYDNGKASTSRKPDKDGWYVFQMAIDGQCKTLKTKSKELATMIDYQNTAIGLELKGDVIVGYTNANMIPGINANGVRGYDVIAINGNELTVRYTVTGSVNTGKEQKITIASNAKIYDVSTGDVATFGQKMDFKSIKVGDRLTTLKDKDGKHALVYVTHKGNRAAGYTSYCPHCDKDVYWCAWSMDGFNSGDDSHLYLFRDINTTKPLSMGNAKAQYTVVIDLNGYTWNRTTEGRAITVSEEETLYILDTVGTGKIRSTGAMAQNAGVLSIGKGAKVHLLSGTLELIKSDVKVPAGGIVNMSGNGSEFHMSGGKLLNGKASNYKSATVSKDGMGGAIYTSNGIVDITGGVIEGGYADYAGGNIYFYGATSVNVENLTIIGGETPKYGGNIFFSAGLKNYTIKNCKIIDGVAGDKGGNIYINGNTAADANVNLINCTISGGKAGVFGNNIYHNKGMLNMTGGSIENGDLLASATAKMTLTGALKADLLNLRAGAIADVSGLTTGASMKVNAEGVFTPEMNNAQQILDAGYIQVGTEGAELKLDGKKLTMSGAVLPEEPPIDITDPTICPHCGVKWEEITWTAWTGAADPASGHYRLEKNLTTAHTNIGNSANKDAKIVLDLNGKILKANDGDYVMGVGLANDSEISLTIIDRVGGGEIQATGKNGGNGVIMLQNGSKLNLFGGTLRLLPTQGINMEYGVLYAFHSTVNMYGGKIADGRTVSTNDASAGNVLLRGNTVMNMYGGEITNGYAAKTSGGVHCYGTAPTFNMFGGTIKDNTNGAGANVYISGGKGTIGGTAVISGGNVANTGDLTITGGTISGGITGKFKSLTVSGNPVINGLEVPQGKVVTLGELTAGAEIWVNANGVFTAENAKAADYATYFKTNIEGASIGVVGNTLAVTGVQAPEEPEIDITDPTICPHCGVKLDQITWTAWTGAHNPGDGHYRLEDNLTTAHTNIGNGTNLEADIVLDLNGKTLTANSGDYLMGVGFKAANNSWISSIKLSIFDSVGGGELQATGMDGNNAGVIMAANGTELNLYSGTIRKLEAQNINPALGALYANGSVVNMYGGKITGGHTTSTADASAGNVLLRGATVFTMYGGEISNGYAAATSGGVHSYGVAPIFNMFGGTIKDNTTGDKGGNVYISGGNATIGGTAVISGGVGPNGASNVTCTGNLTINGGMIDGGVTGNFKSLTVAGNPVVKANTVGIAIPDGKTITLGDLTTGAEIWVNAMGAFTAENAKAAEYAPYFKTNIEGATVVAENNVLTVKTTEDPGENPDPGPGTDPDPVPVAKCPHCDVALTEITWIAWDGTADPAGGHYRLEDNLTTAHANIGNAANLDADIVLDLNGKTWKGNDGDYLAGIGLNAESSITLTVFDSVGGGEMQATGKASDAGVLKLANGAKLNLYSGTIRQLYTKNATTLGAVYVNSAKFDMFGGTITDGYTTSTAGTSAGNVLVRGSTSVMNMYGGKITNGHAVTNGGGVTTYGIFNMSGGTISGNVSNGIGGNICVNGGTPTFSGNAVVKNGVAGDRGANIYNKSATARFENISKLDGDIYTEANVTLVGKVIIPMGNSNGIMIKNGKKLSLTNLDATSEIFFGVEFAAEGSAVFTADGTADYLNCFKNVGRTTSVAVEGTALKAARAGNSAAQQSWCPHCDQYVSWMRSSNASANYGTYTHFFHNSSSYWKITGTGTEVVFDMCGTNTDATNQAFVLTGNNSKLSILDTVGGGRITGKGASSGTTASSNGGVINVEGSSTNATVTLYSGKLALNAAPTGFVLRGGVIAMNSGVLNIKGGIIADGKTTHASSGGAGGNIYLQNTVLNMSGGLVTGGHARLNGGNIYLNSTASANITGGMVENGTVDTNQGGNIFFTCLDSTVSNLVVRGGTTGTFGGNISINAAAKFTLSNVVLAGGTATNGGNMAVGGTLTPEQAAQCKTTVTDCVIYGGSASAEGNDVFVAAGVAYTD